MHSALQWLRETAVALIEEALWQPPGPTDLVKNLYRDRRAILVRIWNLEDCPMIPARKAQRARNTHHKYVMYLRSIELQLSLERKARWDIQMERLYGNR